MKHISVRRAAIGWTTRIEERSCRVVEESEKLLELSLFGLPYPIRTLLHPLDWQYPNTPYVIPL